MYIFNTNLAFNSQMSTKKVSNKIANRWHLSNADLITISRAQQREDHNHQDWLNFQKSYNDHTIQGLKPYEKHSINDEKGNKSTSFTNKNSQQQALSIHNHADDAISKEKKAVDLTFTRPEPHIVQYWEHDKRNGLPKNIALKC